MARSSLKAELQGLRVLPIMTVDDAATGLAAAQVLYESGFRTLEITLRTPEALPAASLIAREIPGMRVALGTVKSAEQVRQAHDAGAAFIVTPGWSPGLAQALAAFPDLACLPGASTVSEAMALAEYGFDTLKWFPAKALGGPSALAAVAAALPELGFCPTGGVGPESAASYLALDCVVCVAGSWPCPRAQLAAGDWSAVAALASAAFAGLRADSTDT